MLMLKKQNPRNLLIDFDFTHCKRCNFLTSTSRYGKFNQENMYRTLSESASFCKKNITKTFWCVLGSQF